MTEEKYWQRVGRNIGILSKQEQQKLKKSTVAIAGIGGVGGLPAERLARSGIGCLKLADPEVFTDTDINRQFGASVSVLGQKKVEVVRDILKDINPDLHLDIYPDGITEQTADSFLKGTDIVLDAIEFFTFKERMFLYPEARKRQIPVILSGAPGFGAPLFVFTPDSMTMEEFFEVPSDPQELETFQIPAHKICPKLPEYISPEFIKKALSRQTNFSALSPGCALAGSLLSAEAIILLLNKRPPVVVPECIMLDLFRQELVKLDLSK